MSDERRRAVILSLAAGALGFLLNSWSVPLFADVPLMFGGVLPLAVALLCGPYWGALAAALAAGRTLTLLGHPYAIAAVVLEAAAVGLLVRRRWMPLAADLLYWAVAGVPLLYLTHVVALREATPGVWFILAKTPLNGLLNVLLAELVVGAAVMRGWIPGGLAAGEPRSLRFYLLHVLVLTTTVPVLGLSVLHWRLYAHEHAVSEAERYHLATLLLALAGIAFSIVFARVAAARVLRPLDHLVDHVRGLHLTTRDGPAPLEAAPGIPAEVAQLSGEFSGLAVSLLRSHQELEQTLAERNRLNQELQALAADLENKVRERTAELEAMLAEVKTLRGLLPVCASCKKIRDEQGNWNPMETYIRARSEAEFSHGICPDCARRLYPEMYS
ncbi:MAG TPA: hypothetical protein VNK82_04785 [Terriglobales bacterium]|nr:hypothetical protein [Terriglobales bacterium]